jgi:type I restriction enzyme S subunit
VKTARLGQIAESLPCDYGDEPNGGGQPTVDVVKVSNISAAGALYGDFERRQFRSSQVDSLLVKEGELLVVKSSGSKANILSGKTAICGADRAGRIVASNFLLRLRIDEAAAVPRFIWYVLNSASSKAFVRTVVGASTYPNLKWSLYASHPIPLPPLPEQRRIADILDKADALRAKRRAALTKLDTLTQSIFLEMFGDPVSNPRGWPESTLLGDVAEIVSGVTIGRNLTGKATRTIPYLAVVNVQERHLDLSATKITQATEDEIQRYRLERDDLLLTEGGDADKLGRGTLWGNELPECIHQNHVFRVRLRSDHVTPLFLNWLVGSQRGKRYFLRSAKQTTGIASINMTQLRAFPLLAPPLALQHQFAERVRAFNTTKASQLQHLGEIDALFASLQHRAFRGEL